MPKAFPYHRHFISRSHNLGLLAITIYQLVDSSGGILWGDTKHWSFISCERRSWRLSTVSPQLFIWRCDDCSQLTSSYIYTVMTTSRGRCCPFQQMSKKQERRHRWAWSLPGLLPDWRWQWIWVELNDWAFCTAL